jgi:hypothetical protein
MAGSDQFVTCNGLRLHYLEAGDANRPTVVLAHGLRPVGKSAIYAPHCCASLPYPGAPWCSVGHLLAVNAR